MKDSKKIEAMRGGGKILSEVLSEVLGAVQPGVSELELDSLAEKIIIKKGGEPGFKKVPGYKYTLCTSVNDVVVHGIPTERKLVEGDIVGIDCGVFYKGYHTDMAQTIQVKSQKSKVKSNREKDIDKFLKAGYEAMMAGIGQAKAGNRIGHISSAMQVVVEGGGYSVVRNLVGHGVGRQLHEDPEIPGYLAVPIEETPTIRQGMTLAIEIIYNMGEPDVVYKNSDGWTISTADAKLSGMFERTILATATDPIFLTPNIIFNR